MTRLLKATSTDPAPGLSAGANAAQPEATSPSAILGLGALSLKESFDCQRKNQKYTALFSLPHSETVLLDTAVTFSLSGSNTTFVGTAYLSETFVCFVSGAKQSCQFAVPYYAVMRVERISAQASSLSVTCRRGVKLLLQFHTSSDPFCKLLKERLQAHVSEMKLLKGFLTTCSSEEVNS